MARSGNEDRTGLVLSGGGARGAYEAGVMAGIVEVLGLGSGDPPPCRIFAGTSVGAINGAWFAAHADRGDVGVHDLLDVWRRLQLFDHLRPDVLGLMGLRGVRARLGRLTGADPAADPSRYLGRSLFDPRPLSRLVTGSIPWDRLHANVERGHLRALLVAALHVGSGVTTIFAELAPGAAYSPARAPRRVARLERVTAEHVLASAAIPFLFPARRVGGSYYCDGGIRFNTPIAPAIRAGAERLVVISLRHEREAEAVPGQPLAEVAVEEFPSLLFLAGKVLNALLLDPVMYDLLVLDRFNALMDALERVLPPEELAAVDALMTRERGLAYRRIDKLVFTPSEDIGLLAGDHLRRRVLGAGLRFVPRWLRAGVVDGDGPWEADWASYLLFDGEFADHLIELGRRDAVARRDEVRAFFA